MTLLETLRKKKHVTATVATVTSALVPCVAKVANVAVANFIEEKINSDPDLEKIRSWLFQIDEPEEDHYLVLNKCRNDPDAFVYFLKWAGKDEE